MWETPPSWRLDTNALRRPQGFGLFGREGIRSAIEEMTEAAQLAGPNRRNYSLIATWGYLPRSRRRDESRLSPRFFT